MDDDSLITPLIDPEEICTKVEIVEVGPVKDVDEDDDYDEFAGLPEILRNQAKSKRARLAARAAASVANHHHHHQPTTSDSDSTRSSTPPLAKSSSKQSTPSKSSNGADDNKYYKNMSRERRLIANARERTRVHTISTAFDALRQAIPTYRFGFSRSIIKIGLTTEQVNLKLFSATIKNCQNWPSCALPPLTSNHSVQ